MAKAQKPQNSTGQGTQGTTSIITSIPAEKLANIEVAVALSVGVAVRKASSLAKLVRTKMVSPRLLPKYADQIKKLTFPVYVIKLSADYNNPQYLIIDSAGQVISVGLPINHPKVQTILKAINEFQ